MTPWIHPTAHIGQYVFLNEDTVVDAHASIDGCGADIIIGRGVRIGPGARIGQAGFGYEFRRDGYDGSSGEWVPKQHAFGVTISDRVDIGANTCIDRGSWRDTYIGPGTKIDNLVHIAHNVIIGADCCIIAGAEISGSCELDDRVYVAPNACVRERLKLGRESIVGLGAVVTKDVPAGMIVAGVPARVFGPVTQWPPPPPKGRE